MKKQILQSIRIFVIFLLAFVIAYFSLPQIITWKMIGIYPSVSENSGRTHYILMRPFFETTVRWFDVSIPVQLSLQEIKRKVSQGEYIDSVDKPSNSLI